MSAAVVSGSGRKNRKKQDKKKPKRNFFLGTLLRLALIAFSIYCAASIVSGQVEIARKREELVGLQRKYEELQVENDELQRILASGDERTYMETVAIGQLGYGYPSEIRFYDTSRK